MQLFYNSLHRGIQKINNVYILSAEIFQVLASTFTSITESQSWVTMSSERKQIMSFFKRYLLTVFCQHYIIISLLRCKEATCIGQRTDTVYVAVE